MLLVEQDLWDSLEIANRYYLIASGRLVSTGVPGKLREDQKFRQAYLARPIHHGSANFEV